MSTSISSAAMIVNLNGLFGTLDPEMEQFESKSGHKVTNRDLYSSFQHTGKYKTTTQKRTTEPQKESF